MTKEQFLQLIDKYLSGNATAAEEALLDGLFNDFKQDPDLPQLSDQAKSELEDKMLQQMRHATKESEKKKFSRPRYFSFPAIAATILLFLTIGGLLYQQLQREISPAAQKKLIKINPAASTEATLRLANGSTLSLKPGANGVLAIQGDVTVKKTKDGQLLYEGANAQGPVGKNYNTLYTPKGIQFQLTLSDGTKVWLNAKSSLTYPTVFSKEKRVVSLKGEAYFEVAKIYAETGRKTVRMPFIVKTDNSEIEVLGTHFNLMAYSDAVHQETTLLEGALNVKHAHQTQRIFPGQQARFSNKNDDRIEVNKANIEAIMSWKSNLFFFEDTKIEAVMDQLARWYGVSIVYEGEIPKVEFTGVLPRSLDVASVLNFLQETNEVKFKHSGNKIIVKNK